MALDEVLLENAPGMGKGILRFYSWSEPAATFGYFQRFAEVEKLTRLRPLVRRPTGGGIVPHDADWTYSLIAPPADPWYELKAVESYQRVHQWIQNAFREAGVDTRLSPCAQKEGIGQCFIGAEQFDLLWSDRKIAGAAQRRTRHGLLIQGSIQPPPGVDREKWLQCFCEIARAHWNFEWEPLVLDGDLEQRAKQLAREKYSRPEYNERR